MATYIIPGVRAVDVVSAPPGTIGERILRQIVEEDGKTVLMVEHNLGVVAHLSDTISVLQRGAVLAEGPYEAVSRNPKVLEAYIGVAA